MKRTTIIVFTLCIVLGTGAFNSVLAWKVEVDNPNGDNVFEFWLRTEGQNITLSYYEIGFLFDATELEYNGVYTNNLPADFSEKYAPEFDEYGVLYGFAGKGPQTVFSEDYLFGTVTMDLLPGATMDGAYDVWLPESNADPLPAICIKIYGPEIPSGWSHLNTEELIRGNNGSGLSNGSGLDIGAPVPVPAAIWLLGGGLAGLLGLRRKRA